nr:unnamed protein product [Callosobruchus analis]
MGDISEIEGDLSGIGGIGGTGIGGMDGIDGEGIGGVEGIDGADGTDGAGFDGMGGAGIGGFGEDDDMMGGIGEGRGGLDDGQGGIDMSDILDGALDAIAAEQEEAAIIEPEQTIDDIIESMKKEKDQLLTGGEEMLGGFGEEGEGHEPGTVCCLSLKIWAVWLLEITHNAHTWTKWVHQIVQKVREFAATIRGDVLLPNGQKKVLYKREWREFAKETEQNIIAWRQYSAHVKDLSSSIVENFHNQKVKCCPKCLQALTEAMNCASYWQRVLDGLVDQAAVLTDIEQTQEESESESEEEKKLEELEVSESSDDESIYEIEELELDEQPGPSTGGDDPGAGPSGQARCPGRDRCTRKFK